jgi:adenylate cyclase
VSIGTNVNDFFWYNPPEAILLRGLIVLLMSTIMSYLLIIKLRQVFRDYSLVVSLILKTCILLLTAAFMNFLLHFTYSVFILGFKDSEGLDIFLRDATSSIWLLHHSIGWIVLFLCTQFAIEFYEKYSPGVFWDILMGRYIRPKIQRRIVMFLDLIDSTPIAEKLSSKDNFSFIRDFIYFVSIALLEYNGRIYQYVGDEIVVSWPDNAKNKENCVNALMLSEKLLNRNKKYFQKHYGVMPEFRAGIHAGEVTVGEIGIIKKDLAISGDTMNTTARIRTACTELNQKCLVSNEFLNNASIGWPVERIGFVDLKGKNEGIELFSIKI